jgi:type I restriction enzyme S subunit
MQTDCFPDSVAAWPQRPMSELAVINPRYAMKKGREYPFVEMASVGENFAGILQFEARSLEGSGLSRFKAGDTLFAKITPCPENGKVAFVASLPDAVALGSTEFIVLSPRPDVVPRFLYHLACSHAVRGRAAARMEGSTGRQRVPEAVFTKWLLVPVPDGDEQAAIARTLDAVDTALQRTRAAIEQAREVKRSVVRRFFYDALGETAYADRPRRKLPPGWALVATERLLVEEPKNGVSPETSSQPPGVPTFSIAAIRDGRVDLGNRDNLKYARVSETLAQRFEIQRGDVLIVRGNANADLVGKAGIVGAFPEGCIYPDIAKRVAFRSDAEATVSPEFAVVTWNHAIVHNQVLRRAKTSNGTLKINNRDVKQIVIPVPPRKEQVQLIRIIGGVDALIDALTSVSAAQERLKGALMHDLLTGRVRVRDVAQAATS